MGSYFMYFIFFFLMALIWVGLTAGTYMFFGSEYEFRQIDANILNYKISKCIIENEILWKNNEEFYDKCRINNESILANSLIFRICRNSGDCIVESGDKVLMQVGGNFQSCRFEGVKGNDAFPKCAENKFEKEGDMYWVIAGSNQHKKTRSVQL